MSRLPALALYLWLLAAGARAACSPGYLKLDLLSSTGGASCGSTPLALCLASFRVDVTDGCTVSVTPLLAAGVYVPGLWSTNPGASYAKPLACPDGAGTAVAAAAPLAAADVQAAIELALERRVYWASYELGLSGAWLNGTLTLTTAADSCSLKYAISEVSTSDYAAQISEHAVRVECLEEGGALVLGTECQTNTATNCPPGARPVTIPSGKVCAACRAGTFSATGSNAGCDACDAGKAAGSVGAAACDSPCAAGSYSLAGSSTCLPCAPGTYQKDAGKSTCSPCPYRSYARRPGATQCVRCVGGVAKCVVGADAGCTPDLADAPSEGYHVLSLTTPATLPSAACALPSPLSFGTPPLFGTCTLAAGTPTKLSLYVDQWCGVEIYPMADAACAEPAAAYWSSMRVKAHYVAPGLIAGTVGAASSSYLLSLMPTTGSVLTLSYWPATTAAANAAAALGSSTVCTGTVDVVGGQVAGLPDSPATCPAGSYTDSVEQDGCRPCPVGAVCDASATQPTTCLTDQYQPYLGQPAGACLTCNASTVPRYTSAAGDDYCTVEWINTTCSNGQQYDEETTACVSCPAGTYRTVGREDLCTPCLPGYYSPAGASDCTICPLNQFSPIYGLAERTTGDKKCLYCPTGSVAKTEAGTVGQQGSTYCDSCDPGTVSAIVAPATYATCAPCTEGYYRSGDASASNNACQPIPAGWKEKARSGTTYDRTQIELCSRGEVSSWSSGARVPSDAQSCQACLGNNKYAPRLGALRGCAGRAEGSGGGGVRRSAGGPVQLWAAEAAVDGRPQPFADPDCLLLPHLRATCIHGRLPALPRRLLPRQERAGTRQRQVQSLQRQHLPPRQQRQRHLPRVHGGAGGGRQRQHRLPALPQGFLHDGQHRRQQHRAARSSSSLLRLPAQHVPASNRTDQVPNLPSRHHHHGRRQHRMHALRAGLLGSRLLLLPASPRRHLRQHHRCHFLHLLPCGHLLC